MHECCTVCVVNGYYRRSSTLVYKPLMLSHIFWPTDPTLIDVANDHMPLTINTTKAF